MKKNTTNSKMNDKAQVPSSKSKSSKVVTTTHEGKIFHLEYYLPPK